jgi:hypothetical protein
LIRFGHAPTAEYDVRREELHAIIRKSKWPFCIACSTDERPLMWRTAVAELHSAV